MKKPSAISQFPLIQRVNCKFLVLFLGAINCLKKIVSIFLFCYSRYFPVIYVNLLMKIVAKCKWIDSHCYASKIIGRLMKSIVFSWIGKQLKKRICFYLKNTTFFMCFPNFSEITWGWQDEWYLWCKYEYKFVNEISMISMLSNNKCSWNLA